MTRATLIPCYTGSAKGVNYGQSHLSLDDELLQKGREAALRDHTSGMLGDLKAYVRLKLTSCKTPADFFAEFKRSRPALH